MIDLRTHFHCIRCGAVRGNLEACTATLTYSGYRRRIYNLCQACYVVVEEEPKELRREENLGWPLPEPIWCGPRGVQNLGCIPPGTNVEIR